MRIYGYEIFEGDKGAIIAENYQEAVKIYHKKYDTEISKSIEDYNLGGCLLTDLGELKCNKIYVCAEW